MVRYWLFRELTVKKIAKSIKEFHKILFFCFSFLKKNKVLDPRAKGFYWGLISLVLLGLISLGSGFLPVESKTAAKITLIDGSKNFKINSDVDLFLSAENREWSGAPEFLLMGNSSLVAVSPTINATPQALGMWLSEGDPSIRQEISEYIVKEDDTINLIAERFGVSVNTVMWANDLNGLSIRPGQKLLILPVSGVMHIVRSGDTINKIAKKYQSDSGKIIAFNYLSEDEKLLEGEVLVVPDGQIVKTSLSPKPAKSISNLSTDNFNGQSHVFPFGQCTWWVAQKRAIPAWGNAKDWLKNAMASGYNVCLGSACVPKSGAVVSLSGDRLYGHVGYVEKVEDDKIVISEMNYIGWGVMNYRTIKIGSPAIKGYIY